MSLVTSSLMQSAAEAELVLVAVLGLVQMGADGHYCAPALQVLDCDDGGPCTRTSLSLSLSSARSSIVFLDSEPVKKALHTVRLMMF